ncbi:MAG: amino acid adenylation domain-containing protein [Deltaproteobacteria bacterium]|nr:amino acid adenylation domain-containing protein [Deltaproteobacteria bacterium]
MGKGLFDLLMDSAQRFSNRTAVQFGDASLSYEHLARNALEIGQALAENGAGSGERVALLLDKSIDAISGLYGVICTGAAYVPLDTGWPARRIMSFLEDVKPVLLLSDGHVLDRIGINLDDIPAPSLCLHRKPSCSKRCLGVVEEIGATSSFKPKPGRGEEPAYILYTSGSTGKPKGVVLSHRAALAFLEWAVREFDFSPEDKIVNHASLAFDLSVLDVFGTAMAGATLLPAPREVVTWPRVAGAWLEQVGASVLYTVPWTYIQLLKHGSIKTRKLGSLRLCLFAGEVFRPALLKAVMDVLKGPVFYNLYGPTETNVCTFHRLPAPPDPAGGDITIGTACCGDTVWIMDTELNPVLPGEQGEIVVSGPTLMSGYFTDGAGIETALVEINPDKQPSKAYRTGDLAKQDENGNIILLGRKDRMVKRRGVRIELGEIERVAAAHPAVQEAAALFSQGNESGSIDLFVTPMSQNHVDYLDMMSFLSERLPRYMLPDKLRWIKEMPRTSTGKLNRRKLENEP